MQKSILHPTGGVVGKASVSRFKRNTNLGRKSKILDDRSEKQTKGVMGTGFEFLENPVLELGRTRAIRKSKEGGPRK